MDTPIGAADERSYLQDAQEMYDRLDAIPNKWLWGGTFKALTQYLQHCLTCNVEGDSWPIDRVELMDWCAEACGYQLRTYGGCRDASRLSKSLANWARSRSRAISGRRKPNPEPSLQEDPLIREAGHPCAYFLRLPEELMVLVIKITTESRPSFPWIFSHINRRCRNLALSLPLLWTSVNLLAGPSRFAEQIIRSQGHPLALSIHPYFDKEVADAQHIVTLLHQQGTLKVRHLKLLYPPDHIKTLCHDASLLFDEDKGMTGLEHVELGTFPPGEKAIFANLRQLLPGPVITASLKSMVLRGVYEKSMPSYRPSLGGLGRLGELRICDSKFTLKEMCNVLAATSCLQRLRLDGIKWLTWPEDGISTVTLEMLEVLEVMDVPAASSLRRHLLAPQVNTLVYKSDRTLWRRLKEDWIVDFPFPLDASAAPSQSIGTLRYLTLIDCKMSNKGWSALFDAMPDLQQLHLSGCHTTVSGLSALYRPMGVVACPELSYLVIEDEEERYDDDQPFTDTVLKIVQAHMRSNTSQPVSSIRTVRLSRWMESYIRWDEVRAIEDLVEDCIVDYISEISERGIGEDDESEVESASSASSRDARYYEYRFDTTDSEKEGGKEDYNEDENETSFSY